MALGAALIAALVGIVSAGFSLHAGSSIIFAFAVYLAAGSVSTILIVLVAAGANVISERPPTTSVRKSAI